MCFVETINNLLPLATQLAFNVDFMDKHGVIAAFLDHLRACRAAWRSLDEERRLYCPYFTVVQSSMMGKTRLFFILPSHNVYIFYICLRGTRSSGFPPCIPELMQALTTPRCTEGFYSAFILASLDELSRFKRANPSSSAAEWLECQQLGRYNFWASIVGEKVSNVCRLLRMWMNL